MLFGQAATQAWQAVQASLNAVRFLAPGGMIGVLSCEIGVPPAYDALGKMKLLAATAAANPPIAIRAFLLSLFSIVLLWGSVFSFFLNQEGTNETPPRLQAVMQL